VMSSGSETAQFLSGTSMIAPSSGYKPFSLEASPVASSLPETLRFQPSIRLKHVCPELEDWSVPEVLIKKYTKKAPSRWAAVKGKILELARQSIQSHPQPRATVRGFVEVCRLMD
jgi:hypothetical protein